MHLLRLPGPVVTAPGLFWTSCARLRAVLLARVPARLWRFARDPVSLLVACGWARGLDGGVELSLPLSEVAPALVALLTLEEDAERQVLEDKMRRVPRIPGP